ncbi:peptidoglycan-binding protein [Streptomyces sp. NPDC050145]|uniref:peptidoglycan-binding protein n=1 Tax=Streptomyces sp. NPDC050145 TaxID=3365602 RepID=UPI003793D06D
MGNSTVSDQFDNDHEATNHPGTDPGQDLGEAEGFGPLRVRPYVTLPEPEEPEPPRASLPYTPAPLPPQRAVPDAERDDPEPEEPQRRKAPVALLAAVAGVLSVAALVTVLVTSGGDSSKVTADEARPSDLVASSAPGTTPGAPSPESSAPSASASTSASASASVSASPSPTPSRTSASPTPSEERTSTAPSPSRSEREEWGAGSDTLSRGDRGPEVSELQRRLQQLNLYTGEPNGNYNSPTEWAVRRYQVARGIPTSTPGAYDAPTRAMLESETSG